MNIIYLLSLVTLSLSSALTYFSVEQRLGKYEIVEGKSPVALAWGYYKHEVEQDGWGKLYIWTSDTFKSHEYSVKTAYAAGYLEGALTWQHIYDHFWSWYDFTYGKGSTPTGLDQYLINQYKFSQELVKNNKYDPYHQALERILAQNDGLYQAIQDHAISGKKLSWVQILLLQACGDIYELNEVFKPKSERIQWLSLEPDVLEWEREKIISCSSLIKAADDWSDVWMSHTTWTSYQNMLRIYKFYQFSGPSPYRVSFSSKPGLLYSKDDFYVLADSNMVVIETTNSIHDDKLYDLIKPESLLTWQRVPLANSISQGGKDWTATFVKYNSGTYNNQYIVIDLKKFVKNQAPTKDFIWISETIPGFAVTQDVTERFLQNGKYWKSYNIPYSTEIYEKAGYIPLNEKYGDKYSYEKCPRSLIMIRDAPKVNSLTDMETFIRYNDYKNDPFSNGNPGDAISSRLDLVESNPRAHGSIDGKVASLESVKQNKAYIQSGPTHDKQPVFSWTPAFTGVHLGQPTKFDFPWVEVKEEKLE